MTLIAVNQYSWRSKSSNAIKYYAYSKHESISRTRDALAIFIFRDENVSLNRHSKLTSSKDYDAL